MAEMSNLDLSHLRREARTALELAIVALAPDALLEALATSAGMLEAVSELPADSSPVVALMPRLVERAKRTLSQWSAWHAEHVARHKA